jgi:O-antigen/teichoic acid export membrane protein
VVPTTANQRRGPLLPGLARNAGSQLAARVIGAGVQAIALVVVARRLGPADYGGFALVSTLTMMATVVADWGVLMVGARAAEADRAHADDVLRACLTLRLGLGVLAAGALVVLGFAGSDRPTVHLATLVAALSFLPGAWLAVASIRAQLDLAMGRVALGAVAGSITSMAWLLVTLALGGGIAALAGSFVANAVVTTLMTLKLTPGRIVLRPSRDRVLVRQLLRDSHPVGVGYLLVTIYFYIDAVLLSRLASSAQLGIYDAAYRFVQVGLMIPGVVVTSLFTVASGLAREDRRRMADFVRQLGSVLALFVPIPLIALATASGDLMAFVYGADYRPGGVPLAWLSFAVSLVVLSGVVGPMLVSLGRERSTMRIAAVATVFNLALNGILIPAYAARGAAIATVLTELAVLTPAVVLLRRELRLHFDVAHLAKVAASGVVGAAVVLVLPGPVLLRIALGLGAYVVALVGTGGVNRQLIDSTRMAADPGTPVA